MFESKTDISQEDVLLHLDDHFVINYDDAEERIRSLPINMIPHHLYVMF